MWLITYEDWSWDKPEYKAVIIRERTIVDAYYTFENTIASADFIVSIVSCYID